MKDKHLSREELLAMQERLYESEERFRLAALATKDAIYDWDLRSNEIWRNDTYEAMFSPNEPIGNDDTWFSNKLHPEDRDSIVKSVDEALASDAKVWHGDYRFYVNGKGYCYMEDSGYILRDAEGKAIRIIGAMTDVTQRKKAEVAAIRLAAIVESSDDGIVGINLHGIVTSWNRGAESIYQFTAEEAIGEHISIIVPKNKRTEINDILEKIQGGEHIRHYETTRIRKDGSILPVSISVSPIIDPNGKLIGTSVITRDISERRQYLKKLRESEERFRYASLATSDSIYDWDLNTNHVWRNEIYQRLFAPNEPIGTDDEWFSSKLHPDDRDRVLKSVNDALENGDDVWTGSYRFQKHDGSYVYVEDSGYIIRDERGRPQRIIGAMTDVTERVEFQEAQKRANEMLEIKVKERTAEIAGKNNELNRNYETLKRLNDDLDSFVHAASHDLKVPIVNMTALVRMLESEELSDRANQVTEKLQLAISRVKNTVDNLAQATKARKNLYDDVEIVNIEHILEEIKEEISEFIKESEAEIEFESEIEGIKFSRTAFKSILYNFLTNGIKYKHPKRLPKLKVKCTNLQDEILIQVSDNGLGLDLDKQGKKLFAIFKRLHDHVEGSGVGLYMVKKIVENNRGRIEVDSELGNGTTFSVYFKKEK